MENSSFDVEAIEIPTPISITFENRCHNCKRAFTSIDYSYNYCPYCGEKKTFKYSTWPDFNSTKNNILNSCGLKSLKNGKLFPEDDRRLISYN